MTQGKRFVLSYAVEDDSRYQKLKEQMGFEGEGVFWAAYRTIRKCGGQYPKPLLIDLLKCHRTPAKRIRHVLEDYGLFEVNQADMISIVRFAEKPAREMDDPRQTYLRFFDP